MKGLKSISVCMLTLLLSARVALCAPPNDNCANAITVGNVTNLHFDTTQATFDGPALCTFVDGANIWYRHTATCTGSITVSLCGSIYDTKLAVYDGTACPPTASRMIGCNDDFCDKQSQITFWATSGNHYLIEVGGFGNRKGQGLLTITTCSPAAPAPSNDDCSNARSVSDVTDLYFDTTGATFDGPGLYMTSRNVWFLYTATCNGTVTVSLCGSSFDTRLAVYSGSTCPPTSGRMMAFNDDLCGQQSQVTFTATAGNRYLVEVGGWSSSDYGHGVISIYCGGPSPPSEPANNNCYNATSVGNVTNLPFDTTNATFDGPGLYMTSPNVWFRYTAMCTGNATISLCGSSFNTKLAVYNEGSCWPTASRLIAYNADYCGLQSQVTVPVVAGNQYLIEVGGWSQFHTGQGVISISCTGTPKPRSNDDCENATPIEEVENLAFDTTNATFDGPGYCMTSPNIWYHYTATCTGNATVSLCGSEYDTMLAIYSSSDCYLTPSELINCNDDFCGWHSQITFPVTVDNHYLIEIGGYDSETGHGVLNISCVGELPEESDLGDAPDSTNNLGSLMTAYPMAGPMGVQASYPTVFNDASGTGPHGPIHYNPLAVAHLGKSVTHETEADIGADQDEFNNIDPLANSPDHDGADNGVVFPLNLPHCRWTTFDYLVNVTTPGTDLWVNVWLDWNRDGDWDDTLNCTNGPAPEWAVQNQLLFNLPAGLQQITTPAFMSWHPQWGSKQIWMRITLSEQPWIGGSAPGARGNGGSGPMAGYEVGETEDYYFVPDTSAPVHESICQDINGDGEVDIDDCVNFVREWLGSCQ